MILISSLAAACGNSYQEKITQAAGSISVSELRDHMYYLASDELGGRLPGERGYDIAANYGASQFSKAGLFPICRDANGEKSFMQNVRIIKKFRNDDNKLLIKTKNDMKSLRNGDDFFFNFPKEQKEVNISASLVFVGYGIQEPEHGWNDYNGIEVKGKWVVYMYGVPHKKGKPVLPEELSRMYSDSMEGYQKKDQTALEAGALGAVIIYNQKRFQMWDIIRHATETECQLPGHRRLFQTPCVEVIINKEPLTRLFKNSPYNPLTGEGEYMSFAMDDINLSLEAGYSMVEIKSANVVGMVEGTDPILKEQYITIGAHLDHVGMEGSDVFNGADDNASGCVALMEIADAVARSRPRRSVIFVLYTGEELMFMGSQYFVFNPPTGLENIIVNINLDMIGRPDGDAEDLAVNIDDKVDAKLRDIVSYVNRRNTRLPLDHSRDEYMNMSDHIYFFRSGIPVVFFHNGDYEDLHKTTDDAEKIDFDFLLKVSHLTYFLIMELANREEKIRDVNIKSVFEEEGRVELKSDREVKKRKIAQLLSE